MNLEKMFQIQKVLDDHIEQEHPRQDGEDRLAKKILSLQVELGELANEWRGFKFWKINQQPVTYKREIVNGTIKESNPLLEEYVDCLHFILSIGLQVSFNPTHLAEVGVFKENDVLNQIKELFHTICVFDRYHYEIAYIGLLQSFNGLGEMLGFSWEQVEQAYLDKNKVNHQRQESGY